MLLVDTSKWYCTVRCTVHDTDTEMISLLLRWAYTIKLSLTVKSLFTLAVDQKSVIRVKERWITKRAVRGIGWAPCINLMLFNKFHGIGKEKAYKIFEQN